MNISLIREKVQYLERCENTLASRAADAVKEVVRFSVQTTKEEISGLLSSHEDGGDGSGNWGHVGVPGQWGGSAPGGGKGFRTEIGSALAKKWGITGPYTVTKKSGETYTSKYGSYSKKIESVVKKSLDRYKKAPDEGVRKASKEMADAWAKARKSVDKIGYFDPHASEHIVSKDIPDMGWDLTKEEMMDKYGIKVYDGFSSAKPETPEKETASKATEAEKAAKEKSEREAKEKAEREAREKAEREAKEKAEKEAKERAEKEAKEKAEREAKEKAEKEAKEKAEKEAKEKAEKEAKEKAEKEAKEKAEKEAKEKAEREAKPKGKDAWKKDMEVISKSSLGETKLDTKNTTLRNFAGKVKEFSSKLRVGKATREQIQRKMKEILDNADMGAYVEARYIDNILTDHFKNLHETKTGGGCTDTGYRRSASVSGFGCDPLTPDKYMEKYGCAKNIKEDADLFSGGGSGYAGSYKDGKCYIKFKDDIRSRTTYTVGDSLSPMGRGKVPGAVDTIPTFNGALTCDKANAKRIMDRFDDIKDVNSLCSATYESYLELQFHGNVTAKDIDTFVFAKESSARSYINSLSTEAKSVLMSRGIKVAVQDGTYKEIPLSEILSK